MTGVQTCALPIFVLIITIITHEANASVPGLNTWHIAQDMSYEMADLSPAFIESNTPMDRVCLLPDQPHFKADFKFNIRATRPIPARCVPGLIDHL